MGGIKGSAKKNVNKSPAKETGSTGANIPVYAVMFIAVFIAVFLLWQIASLQKDLTPVGLYHLASNQFSKLRFERVFCIVAYIVGITFSIVYLFNKPVFSERLKDTILIMHAVISTLLLLEAIFMFVAKSGGDNQLSQIVWMNKYWKVYVPVFDLRKNPMNLREIPSTSKSVAAGGPAIFVVGDSFGAGDGIDDPDSLFSSVIYHKILESDKRPCIMANICERGDGPAREYENLITYSAGSTIVPNTVIWEYYGNDIEEVAQSHGKNFTSPPVPLLGKFGQAFLMRKSFLSDYIFWNSIPRGTDREYLQYLAGLYADSACMFDHVKPIIHAAHWCKENHASFVVVIFPILTEPAWSDSVYARPLSKIFANLDIHAINISDSVKTIPVSQRVVNSRNIHPGNRVHAKVGQIIFDFLHANKSNGWRVEAL